MIPSLYHVSNSIPWLQVYTLSPSLYLVSKSTPWGQVNTMNLSSNHTIRFWKKSNFTMKEIQFHIRTNPITNQKKSHVTLEPIQFHIWINPISQWNKSNFTLEQIKFHIGTNPFSYWNKSKFTLEKGTQRSNVSKRYLKVQGIQEAPKGPRYTKGT